MFFSPQAEYKRLNDQVRDGSGGGPGPRPRGSGFKVRQTGAKISRPITAVYTNFTLNSTFTYSTIKIKNRATDIGIRIITHARICLHVHIGIHCY